MKKLIVIFSLLVMYSSVTLAAGPISFGLQATGAQLNMAKPLNEVYGFGFGGGAHLDINLPVLFAFRIQGDYVTFSPDNAKYQKALADAVSQLIGTVNPADFAISGGRINILSVYANTKMTPLPIPIISPYLTAGLGMANMSVGDLSVKFRGNAVPNQSVPSETKFSANGGAGVDLNLGVLSLYIEARYTWIFTSGETSTYIPVSLGITF